MSKQKMNADMTVALAGNPNVGKSTVFNALTGMHQHTGNWTGKTVSVAHGFRKEKDKTYEIIDLPGTYSLAAHSAEEEVARDFLCFGHADGVIIVCDATRLARNLGLVLQILEIMPHAVVVLNLMDEAQRLQLEIDGKTLSHILGVPVVKASAARGKGVSDMLSAFSSLLSEEPYTVFYGDEVEYAISLVTEALSCSMEGRVDLALPPHEDQAGNVGVGSTDGCGPRLRRFFALRLLEGDTAFLEAAGKEGYGMFSTETVQNAVRDAGRYLSEKGIAPEKLTEIIAARVMKSAEEISLRVTKKAAKPVDFSPADRILTSRLLGIPAMILLLIVVFWLTTVGANYPSEWLSMAFGALETPLYDLLLYIRLPVFLADMLTFGLYRTLSWIISVMLPPMLIFFPLFTILEDIGYLPRIAFNLDGAFCRCGACGKQGLTMCMGLGCNAVGVTGARIIDSRRERLLAVLTNSFIPCNGRFPAMIAIAGVFFAGAGLGHSLITAAILSLLIVAGIGMTFLVSWILSHTLLRGTGSAFLLELPPYRKPQIGKIILRSFLDRTVFVLFRAVTVAIPAGILIWLLSHIQVGGAPITVWIGDVLDPLGSLMGLDGVILLAFLLGLPANEIVLPLCVMLYRADGVLSEISSLSSLFGTLSSNGWTWQTAVCFLIFSVMHSPCATTLFTVKKETGSVFYMVLAFLIPTVCGMVVCMLFHGICCLF